MVIIYTDHIVLVAKENNLLDKILGKINSKIVV